MVILCWMIGAVVLVLAAIGAAVCLGLAALVWPRRASPLVGAGPDTGQDARSLGQLIAAADGRATHIVFVHGMAAEGPGGSAVFRQGLARHVAAAAAGAAQQARWFCDLGPRPEVRYVGTEIWATQDDWTASRPFVDRYVFPGPAGPIVVDEVNWWPLLFPLKIRALLVPEVDLAGGDAGHLKLAARGDGAYHPWIDGAELKRLLATRSRSGGAAFLNGEMKRNTMDWGLADTPIVLGPMRKYIHRAMNQAFAHAQDCVREHTGGHEFVIVSESLGSFVVLDAAAGADGETASVRQVVAETSDLYFLANQFALLELARLGGVAADPTAAAAPEQNHSVLRAWAASPAPVRAGETEARVKQIVSFSDPSDLLTFPVPRIPPDPGQPPVRVVNVYDRNEFSFLRLFANPLNAHLGHSRNRAVMARIFEG